MNVFTSMKILHTRGKSSIVYNFSILFDNLINHLTQLFISIIRNLKYSKIIVLNKRSINQMKLKQFTCNTSRSREINNKDFLNDKRLFLNS